MRSFHLAVSTYCLYSPLLDTFKCQIQCFPWYRDLVSLYDISKLGQTAEFSDVEHLSLQVYGIQHHVNMHFVHKIMIGCSRRH